MHLLFFAFNVPSFNCQWISTWETCIILTHWGRDKMAAIFLTTFSSAFSWMKMFEFWLKISMKFVPKGPINNIPVLVQIMACRRPGDKPLSEPMMISLTTHICVTLPQWVNSFSEKYGSNFMGVFFKLALCIDILSTTCEIGLKWMPQNLIYDKAELVQVMAWYHQATSHYLGHCWPRSVEPYGVTRPPVGYDIPTYCQNYLSLIISLIISSF